MAILTISRQVASLGDEICADIAKKMNYRFFGRKDIEQKIVELGFPKDKLKKFDERKPSFFASLSKDRDEYLDYLQTAIFQLALTNNCILIGRGSFIMLKDIPNHISCRFISDNATRMERLKKEFNFDDKAALKRITESDTNRSGFHKSFFNFDINDPSLFHFVINAGLFDIDTISEMITVGIKKIITPEKETEGMDRINELLFGQEIVNLLIFEYKLDIDLLRASVSTMDNNSKVVTLHGVAKNSVIVERAISIVKKEYQDYKIESDIRIVQDFR